MTVMKPMIGANSTVAKYCAELKIADAVPRSVAGKPGGDDPPVGRERRRLRQPDQEAQEKQPRYRGRPAPRTQTPPCKTVNTDQVKMLAK